MIARCRKAVVNYSKPVLFQPLIRQYLQQQIKPSFCHGSVCVVFRPGKRGEGVTTKRK